MDDSRWVIAAPFRAHLRHICDSTGTPWAVVALHAGLPVRLVRDLLDTRPGRRVHRIAPVLAGQLFEVTEEAIHLLNDQLVPAHTARGVLLRLEQHGWTRRDLACRLHLSKTMLDGLAEGLVADLSARDELRLSALLATGEPSPGLRRTSAAA